MTDMRIAGVIGYPVSHSLSPRLHGFWLQELGISGAYLPLAVKPDGLSDAIAGLKALGFAGANVTIPHKEAVLPLLDRIDEVARAIGAVNTLVIEKGAIEGRNTDVEGLLAHLEMSTPGWRARTPNALVLGAGGAARAVVHGLAGLGVAITLTNRHRERAERLAGETKSANVAVVDWERRESVLPEAGLIVNTTSLGMRGQPPLAFDFRSARPGAIAYDLVYNPLHTEFLRAAERAGLTSVDGLGMLIHQARAGFKAWFGELPPVTAELHKRLAAALQS